MNKIMINLYTLSDPKTPENYRYVGVTKYRLNIRLNKHIYDSKGKSHRGWVIINT